MFYWRLWALMSRYLRINGDWKLYWPSTFPPSRSLELACSLGSNILEVLLCRVFQFQRSLPNIVIFIQFTQRVDKSHPHRLKAKEFLYSLVQVSLWRSLAQSAWSYFSVCPVVRADSDAIIDSHVRCPSYLFRVYINFKQRNSDERGPNQDRRTRHAFKISF